jgi:hypothetical protein
MTVAIIGFLVIVLSIIMIPFFVQGVLARKGETPAFDKGREQRQRKRNAGALWRLVLLAIVYSGLLHYLHTLTGIATLDGIIGLALGLYICAHPAVNAVNMLFFERDTLHQISEGPVIRWLALNLLVLLAGWMVIFVGLRRLVDKAVY